ncbi:MAG: peptide-methionine (S)-S-oxide reductase MsrA [Acholeplasmataceae bacterium]
MEKKIVLAGGCFWGVEAYFKQLKGVIATSVGYVDGNKRNPTYKEVCGSGATHAEATEVVFDTTIISLELILDHFFRIINPYSINRQGNDVGSQYRSGIYFYDASDEIKIKDFLKSHFNEAQLERVQTKVKACLDYDLAETYHQNYLDKNPNGYCHINLGLAQDEEKK